MKRLVFVSIALCLFTTKAEESLYFPILDCVERKGFKGLDFWV